MGMGMTVRRRREKREVPERERWGGGDCGSRGGELDEGFFEGMNGVVIDGEAKELLISNPRSEDRSLLQ
jgi:hypothetical protein